MGVFMGLPNPLGFPVHPPPEKVYVGGRSTRSEWQSIYKGSAQMKTNTGATRTYICFYLGSLAFARCNKHYGTKSTLPPFSSTLPPGSWNSPGFSPSHGGPAGGLGRLAEGSWADTGDHRPLELS